MDKSTKQADLEAEDLKAYLEAEKTPKLCL